ncbi:MAG: hypothetical protein RR537_00170 [Longicatena sp.]
MASIAYVTDKNMIEFHRLNGNHTINFWKPSNSKKMSSFNTGDLLFFLAKGTEKGIGKEKGVIGYGKFTKNYILTFPQMWAKYKTLNGYPSKQALGEAIIKITKNHQLPECLNCLLLDNVVFFQCPIYMSEIGVDISNKIESYIYIDKDDMMNTSKILEVANNVGLDMWSSMYHDEDEAIFLEDALIQTVYNIYEKINHTYYSNYDENRIYKYIQTNEQAQALTNSKTEYFIKQESKIVVCLPCMVNTNDFMKKFQYVIGHYFLYKGFIAKSEYFNEILVQIEFDQIISEELKAVLEIQNIKYKERLVEID